MTAWIDIDDNDDRQLTSKVLYPEWGMGDESMSTLLGVSKGPPGLVHPLIPLSGLTDY
jgi:hypothetical protein